MAAGDKRGRVHLVDIEKGQSQWSAAVGAPVNAVSYAAVTGTITVGLDDCRLLQLSSKTGQIISVETLAHSILLLRHYRKAGFLIVGLARPGGVVVYNAAARESMGVAA